MPDSNLLVIAVDGLRAAALGAYGNTSSPTPALDQWAAESFVFDWCFAETVDPLNFCRSFWRVWDSATSASFSQREFSTTLVTDDAAANASAEAERFGDVVYLPQSEVHRAEDVVETALARLFSAAIDQIDRPSDRRRLIWLHSQGMYGPWDAPLALQEELLAREEGDPPPADELEPPNLTLDKDADPDATFRWSCAYAAQMMALDACVAAASDAIEATGRENWLMALVGLRGFPLGEHGRIGGVDGRLYAEQLHVPAMLRFPNGWHRLERSADLAVPADVWRPLLADETGGIASGREAVVARGPNGARAIRAAEWSLITGAAAGDGKQSDDETAVQLFVRPDDRWEANDVAALCPDVVEAMLARLVAGTSP